MFKMIKRQRKTQPEAFTSFTIRPFSQLSRLEDVSLTEICSLPYFLYHCKHERWGKKGPNALRKSFTATIY